MKEPRPPAAPRPPSPPGRRRGDGDKPSCVHHPQTEALHQCDTCEALLCADCVTAGTHLLFCSVCGERALPLGEKPAVLPEDDSPPEPEPDVFPESYPGAAGGPLYRERLEGPDDRTDPLIAVGVDLSNRLLVPAAMIVMMAALLFYLADVRSVFLGGGLALKWVGFWFVMATVLIARYGKQHGGENAGCYTLGLAVATVIVLFVSPWDRASSSGLSGLVFNSLIILGVWLFGSRLTRRLATEGHLPAPRKKLRTYGLERLRLEAWERRRRPEKSRSEDGGTARKAGPAADAHGNPSRSVARLAFGVLVVFALTEPVLLKGPPASGERAFAAMIFFLLATGVVLAAGSALGTLRHAHALGGRVSESTVTSRILVSAALMAVLLSVALAAPGIRYRGTGEVTPDVRDGVSSELGDPSSGKENGGGEGRRGDRKRRGRSEESRGEKNRDESSSDSDESSGSSTPSSLMIGSLAALGKWLWIPFVIVLIFLAVLVLGRLWPLLKDRGGGFWNTWLRRLARLAALLRGSGGRTAAVPAVDPFAGLESLRQLPPGEAVAAAYGRLLIAFEQLGYPRPEQQTPHEFLASLPVPLRRLRAPLDRLTELYVKAAYAPDDVSPADRQGALAALDQLRRRRASEE